MSTLHIITRQQRGATMVSVLLLTVSLLTVGMLVVKSSSRDLQQASALVARERALMAAQAAIDLGASRLRAQLANDPTILNSALTGYYAAADGNLCSDITQDCIPAAGDAVPRTGQRNHFLTGSSDCAGRPCMRPGSIAFLPDSQNNSVPWVNVPLADLITLGDTEARVSLWVRNNSADALGNGLNCAPQCGWMADSDGRVVFTAMATIRNTTFAIEQEMVMVPGIAQQAAQMQSPDEGYGGGHNNDGSAVVVCKANFLGAKE